MAQKSCSGGIQRQNSELTLYQQHSLTHTMTVCQHRLAAATAVSHAVLRRHKKSSISAVFFASVPKEAMTNNLVVVDAF
uniref:Uncharacterized protein n=1 Tax=Syphacia muris TaxID=451379 RepID=A0A0N5B0N7_9BILA